MRPTYIRRRFIIFAITAGILTAAPQKPTEAAQSDAASPPLLWQSPDDLASRDPYYGPGGRRHEPRGNFTFVKEDLEGTNPKVVVRENGLFRG